MKNYSLRVLIGACILSLVPLTSSALDSMQGKSDKAKKKDHKTAQKDDGIDVEFSVEFLIDFRSEDARRYAEESKLIGAKPLPPGIRKNLARGKPLPPGIAKRDIPDAFLGRLPSNDAYEWRIAGVDLVLTSRSMC